MIYSIKNNYYDESYSLYDPQGKFVARYRDYQEAISTFNTMASMMGLNQKAYLKFHTTNCLNTLPIIITET